jgi:hypothetical protein
MKMSFLYGADLPTLWRLLRNQGFRVQPQALPSLALHGLMAGVNTLLGLPARRRQYDADPVRPVFILGHWRSGTTHLQNLMAAATPLATPTTFQAAFPHLLGQPERWLAPLLDRMGPGTRLMDNMAMTMASPQEEEIAMAALGGPSSYLAIHFPQDHPRYQQQVSLREAPMAERMHWQRLHRHYLRMLTARYGPDRPLLLKSPANTARVRLLLDLYPDARFIHIHRHPYESIRSTLHLYDAWFQMAHFQPLGTLQTERDAHVLDSYEALHRCWFEEAAHLPSERLLMLGFDQLRADPVATLRGVSSFLGDAPLDEVALNGYLGTIRRYQQNAYAPLSPALRREIDARMGFVFEGLGYQTQAQMEASGLRR